MQTTLRATMIKSLISTSQDNSVHIDLFQIHTVKYGYISYKIMTNYNYF